jgi:hypothetical protein
MRFTQIRRQPITEDYTRNIQRQLDGDPLADVYREFGKLTGFPKEDVERIAIMRALLEDDEEFDPFSHLVGG